MMEVKRLQTLDSKITLLSHVDRFAEALDWKVTVQKTVDIIVHRFTNLPPNRHTGLQLLTIIGEEWLKQKGISTIPKSMLEQITAKITQQLLKSLCHVVSNNGNLGYQNSNGIRGHYTINKEGRRQIHVYLVDESLPKICKVYEWYLTAHAQRDERMTDEIIVHFLLDDKQITFSAPNE